MNYERINVVEYLQAIKNVKQMIKLLSYNNYKTFKLLLYDIEHYNYINKDIKFKKYINIYLKELQENNYKFIDLYKRIDSYKHKQLRLRKRIKKMNPNNIWFCTYTINDNNMNKNHTRKLKEINKGKNYIINADKGKQNERLHYHAIIESIEEPTKWNFGYCKMIKINNYDINALTKYIDKLTNHTIKDTAKKIIYSRK